MPSNEYQRYVSDELRNRRKKRTVWQITIGALILVLAIILSLSVKPLVKSILFSKVKLTPTSESYQTWLNPPISTVRKYYLFNITNPLEIVQNPKDTRIQFQDSPPYSYNILTKKNNVQWSEDQKTISYEVERLYTRHPTFDPNSVNDKGIFLNMSRAGFRTQFGSKPSPAFYVTAGDYTFSRNNAIDLLEGLTTQLHTTVSGNMIGPNKEKFGFIYRQNGSRLYNVSINSGKHRTGRRSSL